VTTEERIHWDPAESAWVRSSCSGAHPEHTHDDYVLLFNITGYTPPAEDRGGQAGEAQAAPEAEESFPSEAQLAADSAPPPDPGSPATEAPPDPIADVLEAAQRVIVAAEPEHPGLDVLRRLIDGSSHLGHVASFPKMFTRAGIVVADITLEEWKALGDLANGATR
jgi:hypothetical protein